MANGETWSGLLQGFDCVSLMVHPSNIRREYLNSAIWYWGDAEERGAVPVYQMVWPDAQSGRFPWEEGCGERVRELQPPFYLPAAENSAVDGSA